MSELSKKLAERKHALERLTTQVKERTEIIGNLRVEIELMEDEVRSASMGVQTSLVSLEAAKKQRDSLEANVKSLSTAAHSRLAEFESIHRTLQRAERRRKSLERRFSHLPELLRALQQPN